MFKKKFLAIIGIVQLKSYMKPSKGHILILDPSSFFAIEVYLGPKNHRVLALLDSRASTCLINKVFIKNIRDNIS